MRNAGVSITSRSEEAPKADGGPDPDADPDADAGGTEEVAREDRSWLVFFDQGGAENHVV